MSSRLLLALTATSLLALPTASAPAQGAAPTPGCHGIQITDKAGDSTNSLQPGTQAGSPSTDLIAGWVNYDSAGHKATANIQVDNLTEGEVDAPFVAVGWEMSFSTPAGARFVRAYHDVFGMTKYTWGEPRAITDDQTAPRLGGATTGALFPGKGGVIQIEIPLADVGAPAGTTLKGLALEVRQWISLPAAVPSTGLPLFSPAPIFDDAAGKAITLGPCPAAGGPAPGTGTGTGTGSGSGSGTGTGTGTGTGSGSGAKGTFDLKVTIPKLTAKKLAKSKRFTIKLSGTASDLTAAVRKSVAGGKNLATGKLKSVKGSGKLTLKTKGKLKKGTYVLVVSGKNASGQPAEGALKFKVR